MLFRDIIGQDSIKYKLAELVYHNRLSHALLFLGSEGSGALPLALAFAQFIVCDKRNGRKSPSSANPLFDEAPIPAFSGQLIEACGTCASCIRAGQLIHPDIHFSYPVIPKKSGDKPLSTDFIGDWREFIREYPYGNIFDWLQFIGAENKQGNITAYECNDIIRKLSLKSFESGYKILIMWMPEYLGNEGNKLLKLIEEPPADTLFVLVAENESLILPTIVSRTQLIKIPALETKDIGQALVERAKISVEQAKQIASFSQNNYREALQLLQHSEDDSQGLLRDWLNAILKTGPISQVKWVEEVSRIGRERQKQFLLYFIHMLEQAIRVSILGNEQINLSEKENDFAIRLNRITDMAGQQVIIRELNDGIYYIERNANAKLLFHALTIKLYHIIANKKTVEIH